MMHDEGGFALLEGVIGTALLAMVVVIMVAAVTTHSLATRSIDANSQALQLVRTQLEDIQAATYATGGYPVTVTVPSADYAMAITATEQATGLQLVTVTLTRSGNTHLSVEMYKADVN